MKTVEQYLKDYFKSCSENKEYRTAPKIVCSDGFEVSIQGGTRGHYCNPRECCNIYYEVECGFPSEKEDLLMPYAENPNDPTKTVYGYVPIEVAEEVIKKHGGIREVSNA